MYKPQTWQTHIQYRNLTIDEDNMMHTCYASKNIIVGANIKLQNKIEIGTEKMWRKASMDVANKDVEDTHRTTGSTAFRYRD